jgi:hypothetical protein
VDRGGATEQARRALLLAGGAQPSSRLEGQFEAFYIITSEPIFGPKKERSNQCCGSGIVPYSWQEEPNLPPGWKVSWRPLFFTPDPIFGPNKACFNQCWDPLCLSPGPGSEFCHPGSRVEKNSGSRSASQEFKYFNPKNFFKALGNMIRVVHPGSGY